MKQNLATVALECIFDLGITVVYAVIVGFLIVGVVASDEGPMSILRTSLCAFILPGAAMLLIAAEIALRFVKEQRAARLQFAEVSRMGGKRREAAEAFAAR